MNLLDILKKCDFGNYVAEHETSLHSFFIETNVYYEFINNKIDIIAGDKGAGKTAIYKYLTNCPGPIDPLRDVEIISGFNPSGNPIFQRLTQLDTYKEGEYIMFWKLYILSLVGNWVLDFFEEHSNHTKALKLLLEKNDLRCSNESEKTLFSYLCSWFQKFTNIHSFGIEISNSAYGTPLIMPKIEFGSSEGVQTTSQKISIQYLNYDEALSILDSALKENEIKIWFALDRLDESFIGYPEIEILALRALFRTYLDLKAFNNINIKLFVRKDLFRKVTEEMFVNLSHINAKKKEIIWDDSDLFYLICKRIRENKILIDKLGLANKSNEELFNKIFPDTINDGKSKNPTWNWMLKVLRDGNKVVTPRNLIDLLNKTKDEQIRLEQRNLRSSEDCSPIFQEDSLHNAFRRVSKDRIDDTILSESSKEIVAFVKAFQNSKCEHNLTSISQLFGVDIKNAEFFSNILISMGFIEWKKKTCTYTIPILYRPGLNIKSGKAFKVNKYKNMMNKLIKRP